MIAAISLIRRRPDLSLEQFRRHWLHPHGTMTAELPATRRYVQHHPIEAPGMNAYARSLGVDGIPELWFDDVAARTRAYTSPRIAECNVDSENFIGAVTRVVSEPRVAMEPADADGVARVLLLAVGAPDRMWAERQEARAVQFPGLVGFTGHRLVEQAAAPNSKISEMVLPVAGLAEVVFADEASLLAAVASLVVPDDTTRTAVFRVEDHRLV